MKDKSICSIKGCGKPKYIGFLHFVTHESYRLCQMHYYDFLTVKTTTIDRYIFFQSKITEKEQVRLI
jgi:hypothetical protein